MIDAHKRFWKPHKVRKSRNTNYFMYSYKESWFNSERVMRAFAAPHWPVAQRMEGLAINSRYWAMRLTIKEHRRGKDPYYRAAIRWCNGLK